MDKKETLLYIILLVAVVALGLSINSYIAIRKINKEIAETDLVVEKMKPIINKFEPLLPQIETLRTLLPRLEQALMGTPPVPSE